MKTTLTLLALVLLLPTVAAEPNPVVEKDDIARLSDRAVVHQMLTFRLADADVYDGRFRMWLPASVSNFSLAVEATGMSVVPPASILQTGTEGGFKSYEADLRSVMPSLPEGREYRVFVAFVVNEPGEISLRTWYRLVVLMVQVDTEDGAVIAFRGLNGGGGPIREQGFAYGENVAGNTTYTIETNCCNVPTVDRTPIIYGVGGLVLGALVILFAIRRGWVKAAGRVTKFEKGGAMESRTMLEARRRTLLAALKELEQAHEAKEVPDDAYSPLKEEYKAQAVRVMRNLEEKKE